MPDHDSHWVLDADASEPPDLLGWCPFEMDTGNVVIGLLILQSGDLPPHGGRFVGVYHPDGQEAVEAWCDQHAGVVDRLVAARDAADRALHTDSPIVIEARAG